MRTWGEVVSASDEELLAWAERQSWAEAMRACGQDAEWHAEGDVWTHTRMVWEEVGRLGGFSEMRPEHRRALRFAALWHDAGKPATTCFDEESGRTRSPKHSICE